LVPTPSLSSQEIEDYAIIIAAALGVERQNLFISYHIPSSHQTSRRLLTITELTLYITVRATSQQNAVSLSSQISTTTFQYNINYACQAQGLSSAIIDATSLSFPNASPIQTTPTPPPPSPPPAPPPPPPPSGSDPPTVIQLKNEASDSTQPPAVLTFLLCLLALAFILPHAEDYD
jgi:hypothetical protein